MSKLLPDKLNEKSTRFVGYWLIKVKTDINEGLFLRLHDDMTLHIAPFHLVHLDSAEDLQAFLTGIKGKMMNEHGEVAVSDLTDAMSEDDFVKLICEITEVDPVRLKKDTHYRGGMYPLARQLHMIVRNLAFKMSTAKAAEYYNQDHCATLHAKKVVLGMRQVDPAFRRLTDPIFSEIDAIISGNRRTM